MSDSKEEKHRGNEKVGFLSDFSGHYDPVSNQTNSECSE